MAEVGPGEVVQAPPAVPPATGLLVSVTPVETTEDRWIAGVKYAPENMGHYSLLDSCTGGAVYGTGDSTVYANLANVYFRPYSIETADECSTFGFEARDYEGRATRQTVAVSSKAIENELWTGAGAIAAVNDYSATSSPTRLFGNHYLADPRTVDITPGGSPSVVGKVGAVRGLAALEQSLSAGLGNKGMIHARLDLVTVWAHHQMLLRTGNVLTTYLGTIVIAGAGYPGTGPAVTTTGGAAPALLADGTDQWAFATDLIAVRVGQVEVPADITSPTDLSRVIDKATNTVAVRGQRFAAATWDGRRQFACHIDITAI